MTVIARRMATKILLLFLATTALADEDTTEPEAASSRETGYSAHYRIEIPADDHRVARVDASLNLRDRELYMSPGANQLPKRWSTFVSDLRVLDENGQTVPVAARDDGSWHMLKMPQGRIKLSYRVNLEHEDHAWSGGVDGAAYWREWGVFYTARSLFILNGDERDDIAVDFHLPDGWRVTAPWQPLDDGAMRFVVPDHEVLATSMFFAGTHREISVREGPFEFLLALGGEDVLAQEDVFVDLAEGVLDYYVDLMGDIPGLQSAGSESRPVVIINQAAMTDGEAIGNNISILLEPSGDPMSQHVARLIFTHEFFHLWNGKSFMPRQNDAEWFKEGFTNYYTLKALHHVGYLTDESFLELLAGFFYQRYDSDDAVGQQSLTRGDLKHDHWGLIYSGGMLVAIAQDLQIRSATANEKSLDDLMRYMFEEYAGSTYDLDDIEQALSELNPVGQDDFFDRYIYGTERIDIAPFLKLADIETVEDDGRTFFRMRKDPDPNKVPVRRGFFGE